MHHNSKHNHAKLDYKQHIALTKFIKAHKQLMEPLATSEPCLQFDLKYILDSIPTLLLKKSWKCSLYLLHSIVIVDL